MERIIHGNCIDVMKRFPDECIDLTITSPPYDNLRDYQGYDFDYQIIAMELFRLTKSGGVIVWIVGDQTIDGSETGSSFKQALYFKEIGFRLHDTMIWNKGCFTAVASLTVRYASVFDYMFVFSKGRPSTFNPIKDRKNKTVGKKPNATMRDPNGSIRYKKVSQGNKVKEYGQRFNIWDCFPRREKGTHGHPAPFPEQLAHDHIISWSNKGDLVFDPMCGSGTTCKMAYLLNRQYIGIDISLDYCQIARERLKKMNKQEMRTLQDQAIKAIEFLFPDVDIEDELVTSVYPGIPDGPTVAEARKHLFPELRWLWLDWIQNAKMAHL